MALLYRADLSPSKLDLVRAWVPRQTWFDGGDAASLELVGAFRFDDPEGEVGIETLLVRAIGGPAIQVPLTYRASPLYGADEWLIGTMEHSVLGTRWCYDGAGDPVYLAAVANAALRGEHEAELQIEVEGVMTVREPTATVAGSGSESTVVTGPDIRSISELATSPGRATEVRFGDVVIEIVRQIDPDASAGDSTAVLTGAWASQASPVVLARVDRKQR